MGDPLVLFKHGVLIALVAAVYFLPSIIARVKGLRSSIYVINLLLGWTVLGWLIAFSLALSEAYERQCQTCAALVDRKAIVCPYCHKLLEARSVVGGTS
jgi:hypothetical protein